MKTAEEILRETLANPKVEGSLDWRIQVAMKLYASQAIDEAIKESVYADYVTKAHLNNVKSHLK